MTHSIAARDRNVKVYRPRPDRFARQIGELSRHWVDADFAGLQMEDEGDNETADRRFAKIKSHLVNFLGLKMYVEQRVKEGRRRIQVHHLPRQSEEAIEEALALLTDHDVDNGVADVIRELGAKHPFANGDIPEKPGWTYAEADAMGMKFVPRHLKAEALAWMSREWLTVKEWDRTKTTTRLPAIVNILRNEGYDISSESVPNPRGGPPYATYRYFTDQSEREAWFEKQRVQQALAAENAERLRAAEAQAKVDAVVAKYVAEERKATEQRRKQEAKVAAAAARDAEKRRKQEAKMAAAAAKAAQRRGVVAGRPQYEGGSSYGGWKRGYQGPIPQQAPAAAHEASQNLFPAARPKPARVTAPTAPTTPTAPPPDVMNRLGAMASKGRASLRELPSAPGVPATELNQRFPRARSGEVVEMDGAAFKRRFLPRKEREVVVAWETFWEPIDAASTPREAAPRAQSAA